VPSNAQFCDRAPDGCPSGPEQVYEQYFGFVWRNLRRLGVTEQALDDAAQEVFLVVFRRYAEFEGRSSVQTWLFGIVLRVARDQRKAAGRRGRRLVFLEDLGEGRCPRASDAECPHLAAERGEATRLLHRLLESLADEKRALFISVELEQMNVPEAAEALGLKLNTAYARLRAARLEFEAALARYQAQGIWRRR
jgi:RNA polymerase sigma-70 factor, ECF subfamily